MSLETATTKIQDKIQNSSAELGSTVKFNLGDGIIYVDGTASPHTVSHDDKDASCTITMDVNDFIDMMDGNLDPTGAFMGGKMKIDGDMGVAMKLSSVFA